MPESVITKLTPRTLLAGSLIGLSLVASACGGSSRHNTNPSPTKTPKPLKGPAADKPYDGILHCTANDPEKWQSAAAPIQGMGTLDAEGLAGAMGVTPEQVRAGKWGSATCKEAIETSQVNSAHADVCR